MSEQVKVWQINDCEWWIGAGTAESMLAAYMADIGLTHEEATGDADEMPRELTDEELDRLHYADSEEDDTPIPETKRTFREQMQREIDAGTAMPCLFATTEY